MSEQLDLTLGTQRTVISAIPPLEVFGYKEGSQAHRLIGETLQRKGRDVPVGWIMREIQTTNHRRIFVEANDRLEDPAIVAEYGKWHFKNNGASGGESAYYITTGFREGR